jgi:hypothetical protein
VEVAVGGLGVTVPAADVRRVDWQRPDSALNGILIGAAAGATPGLYWLFADPNECAGLCLEDYVAIAVGAIVGGLIDRIIRKRVTVYDAERSVSTAHRVSIAPTVSRSHTSLTLLVRF